MKRKIISIDEDKCVGCGNCTTGCAEGALQIVNGKAKLVKENFCDGFGDCIGTCPTGALQIIEREADDFDPEAVKENLLKTQGEEAVKRMEEAHIRHANAERPEAASAVKKAAPSGGGCPGMRQVFLKKETKPAAPAQTSTGGPSIVIPSELEQWPCQLHLVSPMSPFLQNKEMVLMSTCGPVASPDVHWRYIKGRSVVVACPKLDKTEPYVEKLTQLFAIATIPKVIVVRMEVPCCGGLTHFAKEAMQRCGRTDLIVEEHTLGLDGSLKKVTTL